VVKAGGLLLPNQFCRSLSLKLMADINVVIPKTVIVGTDEFESFMEQMDYCEFIENENEYADTRKLFSELNLIFLIDPEVVKTARTYEMPAGRKKFRSF
jgi:hypothetical protein